MPALSAHQSQRSVKLLLMGNSGTGKTGALTSLVSDGYKLRILDMDNGLDSLRQFILHDCPDKIDNVEFRTLRDKYKTTPSITGTQVEGLPKAFPEALKMLDRWAYTENGTAIDLGKPAEWDDTHIVVIDSSTLMGDAAFNWAHAMNPGAKDMRGVYGDAQGAFENMIALLTSPDFRPHVIMISHIKYMTNDDGTSKGFPTAVGQALGPTIPAYFNNVALMESTAGKRTIKLAPTATIDLKNAAPFKLSAPLPIETGLATFFKTVRGQ